MIGTFRTAAAGCTLAVTVLLVAGAAGAEAQERGKRGQEAVVAVDTLSRAVKTRIRAFYEERSASDVKPLPPGIRKNLARGKPLPPGIAKQVAPDPLHAELELAEEYELVEVGLDVVLVEVATGIIHDVLRDVIG